MAQAGNITSINPRIPDRLPNDGHCIEESEKVARGRAIAGPGPVLGSNDGDMVSQPSQVGWNISADAWGARVGKGRAKLKASMLSGTRIRGQHRRQESGSN
jgi:hypothetical protein